MKPIPLTELRRAHQRTQVEVAAAMRVSQPAVSKLESGRDVSLAQLREYVRALGGELVVSARFGTTLTPLATEPLRYGARAPTRRVAERAHEESAAESPVVAPEWLDEVDRIRAMTPAARMQEVANVSQFFSVVKRRV